MATHVDDRVLRNMLDSTICPKTPRDRNMPKDTRQALKAQSDANYKVDARQFNSVLKEFAERAGHLAKLNFLFGTHKATKGAILSVTYQADDGKTYQAQLSKKELKAANSSFQSELLCLKHYFRMSKKKAREKAQPSSLKGTFTPVYAGAALREFLTRGRAGFGTVDPSNPNSGLLMDQLRYAQNGYMLRNSTTMLFFIYAHVNQLQFEPGQLQDGTKVDASWTRSDTVMNAAFGGNIPPVFYRDVAKNKFTVAEAQAGGVPQQELANTYAPIQSQNNVNIPKAPGRKAKFVFRPDAFKTFFFQNIAGANYYSKNNLARAIQAGDPNSAELQQALANLQSPEYEQGMLAEHELIKRTSVAWGDILEPGRKQNREARKRESDAAKKAAKAAARR